MILYGKPCADRLGEEIKNYLYRGRSTKLYTVGFDEEKWNQYTSSLLKSAMKYGVECENITVGDVSPEEFYKIVQSVCSKKDARGVMLQQPLPKNYAEAVKFIDVDKDVDCLNPLTVAKMYNGEDGFRPATPSAVLYLLDYYGIDLLGKNVAVIGRGNAVGKPFALMALQRNATVTVCHSKTVDLAKICRSADIIVSACGVCGLVTDEFVNENSIVIDVGLSFVNGKTCGDVALSAIEKCSSYSPVPGGIGPVTRAALFLNMVKTDCK